MKTGDYVTKPETFFGFDDLLKPMNPIGFFDKYWETKPLVLSRKEPNFYQGLFSIKDVDRILDLHRPIGDRIRVVKNEDALPANKYRNTDGSLNLNQIYAAYADGYTIVINEIDSYWQPIKIMCQQMSQQLSHPVSANMYLTPQNQKALLPHYDTHDVFVVQIHGKKHWKIYDSPIETPLLHSFQPIFKREELSGGMGLIIYPGDTIYLPRGVPHEAWTADESSLHLAIAVKPYQWLDLFIHAMNHQAFSKPGLRKALPPGYLNSENWNEMFMAKMQGQFSALLESVLKEMNLSAAIQLLSENFRSHQSPRGDGHFGQMDKMDQLHMNSFLEKRKGITCTVQNMGTASRIIFPGNMIKGPAHVGKAFQFIADAEGAFRLGDLPWINDPNKIKLAARLIRGGLLKVC